MKSKLATVGVTCDCKGSQLLKGEAKFEKEEDKAGQKSDEVQQEEFFHVLSPLWTISQYFPIFHTFIMGLSVPQANVDCRGQGGRIPREDCAQVLQREEFFPETLQ